MRVSVIIPSCRVDFMGDVFSSLKDQTMQPHEVLYSYSTGGISSISEKINALASIATGDAYIILCDDDMLEPTFIERTVKVMEETKAGIVYTDMRRFGNAGDIQYAGEYTAQGFRVSTVPFITSLISKFAFDSVGGWDPEQDYADYDFYYRCFKRGITGNHVHEPLFLYRVHGASGSFNMSHSDARNKMLCKHPELQ